MTYEIIIDGREYRVELLQEEESSNWHCNLLDLKTGGSQSLKLNFVITEAGLLSLLMGGKSYEIIRDATPSGAQLVVNQRRFDVEVRDPRSFRSRRSSAGDHDGPRKLLSPMPGKVVRILASAGTVVEAGEGIVVIEAMKMQNELKSPKKGTVQKILVAEGAATNAGDVLAIVE